MLTCRALLTPSKGTRNMGNMLIHFPQRTFIANFSGSLLITNFPRVNKPRGITSPRRKNSTAAAAIVPRRGTRESRPPENSPARVRCGRRYLAASAFRASGAGRRGPVSRYARTLIRGPRVTDTAPPRNRSRRVSACASSVSPPRAVNNAREGRGNNFKSGPSRGKGSAAAISPLPPGRGPHCARDHRAWPGRRRSGPDAKAGPR